MDLLQPQQYCRMCKNPVAADVPYKDHLVNYHKLAPDVVDAANPGGSGQAGAEVLPVIDEVRSVSEENFNSETDPGNSSATLDVKPVGLSNPNVQLAFKTWFTGKCKFRCAICQKDGINNSVRFWNHVRTTHSMSHLDYRSLFPGDYFFTRVKTICQLCEKVIDHDRGKLIKHFVSHGMKEVNDYMNYFVDNVYDRDEDAENNSAESGHPTIDDEVDLDVMICEDSALAPTVRLAAHSSAKEASPTAKSSPPVRAQPKVQLGNGDDLQALFKYSKLSDILDQSKNFICKICFHLKLSPSMELVQDHLAENHKINCLQYYKLFVSPKTWYDGYFYSCSYCDANYTVQPNYRSHLDKVHGIRNPPNDRSGLGISVRSLLCCFNCKLLVPHNKRRLTLHQSKCTPQLTAEQYLEKTVKFLKDRAANRKRKLKTKCPPARRKISDLCPPLEKVYPYVESSCKFSCSICSETTKCWLTMYKHYKKSHLKEYDPNFHRAETLSTRLEYYVCEICGAKMIKDRKFIGNHLSRLHNMRMEERPRSPTPKAPRRRKENLSTNESTPAKTSREAVARSDVLKFNVLKELVVDGAFNCLICRDAVVSDVNSANDHCLDEHGINLLQYCQLYVDTQQWTWGCLYYCQLCKAFCSNLVEKFRRHLKTVHHPINCSKFAMKYARDEYNSCKYVTSYIDCPKCHRTVIHEKPALVYHQERCFASTPLDDILPLVKNKLREDVDAKRA